MAGQPSSPDAPQYNLRLATEQDIEVLLSMGEKFYSESPFPAFAEWDTDSANLHIFNILDNGVIILAETADTAEVVGLVALMCVPWPYNAKIMMATEMAFYIEPEHRGLSLAKAMKECAEAAAELEGCKVMSLMALSTTPPQADMLYRQSGFQPIETAYLKAL